MKKLLAILLMILLLSGVTAIAVSAAEVNIEGVTTDNTPVQSTFGDRTVEVNKTIETIESTQSVDVKLTLKSSHPSPTPTPGSPAKTGDGNGLGFVLALFVSAVAGLLLFKKKARKTAMSLLLVVCLLAVLAPAGALVFAQSAEYTVTELFTEEALAGFTFDRVVSGNVSAVETIENDNGRIIGLTWTTDAANAEQSVVYRLTLNTEVPETVIGKALNVSDAELVFTDAQGKTSALAYPDVSVKLTQNAPAPVAFTFNFNNIPTNEYTGSHYPGGVTQPAVPGSLFAMPSASVVFPEFTGFNKFLGWSTVPNGDVEYAAGDTVLAGTETRTFYALWKSLAPTLFGVADSDINVSGTGVYGIGAYGATIVVTFPNGAEQSVTVPANGLWTVSVPMTERPLIPGTVVTVVQTERGSGKKPSDPVYTTVFEL